MVHITLVVGARPNFVKIAPIVHAIHRFNRISHRIEYRLVHTGQHYDDELSRQFFIDLNIPEPDVNLNCKGQTQAEQTASIMVNFESDLMANPSGMVIVVGDVNSTMACAITAKKLNTPVAHIEAGIRSFDDRMPEEINRRVTDAIADYFFTTSRQAKKYLEDLGFPSDKIFFVGNVMIDTLLQNEEKLKQPTLFKSVNLDRDAYWIMTLHRPSNVDDLESFEKVISSILDHLKKDKVIFPMHPRTKKIFNNIQTKFDNLLITEPLGYLEFNYLVKNSKGVITDSGGISEETTVMNVPCITLRENTERPETVRIGTNVLVGKDVNKIKACIDLIRKDKWKEGKIPDLWDGKSSERIVNHLYANLRK